MNLKKNVIDQIFKLNFKRIQLDQELIYLFENNYTKNKFIFKIIF